MRRRRPTRSRSVRSSATGAFDDGLAGLLGGGVVTDNRRDELVRRFELPGDCAVALWIPDRTHPPSSRLVGRFRRDRSLARRAVDAALDGDWCAAMRANSALVERAMGYRYAAVHDALRNAGATVSGVSGLGPAVAAVVPHGRVGRVVRAFPTGRGPRRSIAVFAGRHRESRREPE